MWRAVARLEENASFERNQDDEVVGVTGSSQTTDDDLMGLKGMTNLIHLNLGNTQITDAGLVKALARAGALLAPCRHVSQRACF